MRACKDTRGRYWRGREREDEVKNSTEYKRKEEERPRGISRRKRRKITGKCRVH